jgi:hypothetical protein
MKVNKIVRIVGFDFGVGVGGFVNKLYRKEWGVQYNSNKKSFNFLFSKCAKIVGYRNIIATL